MDVSPIHLPATTPSDVPHTGSAGTVPAVSVVSIPASAQGAAQPSSGMAEPPSADSLAHAVKQANDSFAQRGQNLYATFEKDKITGIDVVKIMDKKTHKVVGQMPAKEVLAFARALEDPTGTKGQLVDATA